MGFIKPTFLLKGAAEEGVDIFNEAEQIGKEGVSILKEATDEVQEEIKTVSNNYDKAIALSDSVGGGAFGKYLFNYYGDVGTLANLSDLAPEDRTKQLSIIKSEYNNLPADTKAKLEDGDFSEMVDKQYNIDIDRIKKGLVNENNMGEATANTLVGKIQRMVDKSQFAPQRESIISSVTGRDLRESVPVEGGFESIASGQQGPIDYLMAGSYGEDIQKMKMEAENGFEKFLTSNRFKQEGTNMFFERGALEFIGNIIFPDGISPSTNSVQDVRDTLENISRETDVSPALVAESILKDYYLEQTYQGFFDYTSFYDMYELNEATKAYEASKNQTEQS